jgi:transposase, IS30 family
MPHCYEHINLTERERIALMISKGLNDEAIALELGRHRTTIWRERRRNGSGSVYLPGRAHKEALNRRGIARRPCKLRDGAEVRRVRKGLRAYWSPDQISGRGHLEGVEAVSRMTIYRWIDEHRVYRRYLRGPDPGRRIRRRKHERIHDRVMIDDRPDVVSRRERTGDWESDTVRGPMSSKACVATHVDRQSRYLVARLLRERNGEQMNLQTVRGFKGLPVHTLTVDNGMEFGSFKKLERALNAEVFFAHKKCPWQRALNENTNGLLRCFFPKGTDFAEVSPAQLSRAVTLLNNRPRKVLGYKTPKEVMNESLQL